MKTTEVAVLHLGAKAPADVHALGGKVLTALSAHPTVFTNLRVPLPSFTDELSALEVLLRSQDGSDNQSLALEKQSSLVYESLKSYCFDVNKTAAGDAVIIGLSGFDSQNRALAHTIPGKTIIKYIDNGSTEHSAKIIVISNADADRYMVEMTTNPADPNSWKLVLNAVSSRRLEIEGLTRGQEVWFRVTAGNTHGWGAHSDAVGFVPQ